MQTQNRKSELEVGQSFKDSNKPAVMYLLHQGCTSPHSLQKSPAGDQVFKRLSLWVTFLIQVTTDSEFSL